MVGGFMEGVPGLVGLAMAAFLAVSLGGCGSRPAAGRVEVADLVKDRARYEGVEVSMVLSFGERSPDDPRAGLRYRSDAHLHDDTGTLMVTGGWLINQSWKAACKSYEDERVKIGLDGVWQVKKALVAYDDKGLPYLDWPK